MKFGTFKGVFVPSTEAILGTVLFLLLPTLVGDVGLVPILLVIILAHSVTVATAFSLADCATNLNTIGGGGMYALSKRSLGKAFGGSIGIQLYFAQAASIGFYCIGFAEPLQPILSPFLSKLSFFIGAGGENVLLEKQVLASIVFLLFFTFAVIGADFTLKIQSIILFVLIGSIVIIFISPFTGILYDGAPLFMKESRGLNYFGGRGMTVSLFFLTFTQFFPAVTGIDAGVGMSGDLKDPKKSLVRGTFSAIAVTFTVYMISAVIFSMIKTKHLVTGYVGGAPTGSLLTDLMGMGKSFPDNFFGLMILAGILFATSSSALSCFMTAPRTLQSLARDNVLPSQLSFLGKDFRKGGDEPRFATLISFFFGISVIWIGNINFAAMIVGICFLIVYGWVNGSAFLERISGNPTFRPTSKGHWLISLYGFAASLVAMILFSWITGVLIVITQFIVFRLILRYKAHGRVEGVWWGVVFAFITMGLRSLKKIVQGTKNWRPVIAVLSFSGKKDCPGILMKLADMIASYKGVVTSMVLSKDRLELPEQDICKIDRPVNFIDYDDPTESIMSIVQAPLMGDIPVNTILLEYTKKIDNVKVINKILSLNKNILLLKNGDRLKNYKRIDIWWRGENNGNLMVLLAYIIKTTFKHDMDSECTIRIIRMLQKDESTETATSELNRLLSRARLSGEVLILPLEDAPFHEVLANISYGSNLIMMGIPGNSIEKDSGFLFMLNEFFFSKEIEKYSDMPPILFVRSAYTLNLIED